MLLKFKMQLRNVLMYKQHMLKSIWKKPKQRGKKLLRRVNKNNKRLPLPQMLLIKLRETLMKP